MTTLSMRRIVLFTKAMPRMVAFYRDVLDLPPVKDEKGWKELDANGGIPPCTTAPLPNDAGDP